MDRLFGVEECFFIFGRVLAEGSGRGRGRDMGGGGVTGGERVALDAAEEDEANGVQGREYGWYCGEGVAEGYACICMAR